MSKCVSSGGSNASQGKAEHMGWFNRVGVLGNLGFGGVIHPDKKLYLGKLDRAYIWIQKEVWEEGMHGEGRGWGEREGEGARISISQDSWRHQQPGPGPVQGCRVVCSQISSPLSVSASLLSPSPLHPPPYSSRGFNDP